MNKPLHEQRTIQSSIQTDYEMTVFGYGK